MAGKATIRATITAAVITLSSVLAIPAAAQDEGTTDPTPVESEESTTSETTDDSQTTSTAVETTTTTAVATPEPTTETTAEATATTTAATSTVIAKRGDRGSAVRDLQTRLARAGFSPGVIDGIFGRLTQGALVAFQNAVGLSPTGVYDSVAADKLASYQPPAQTPAPSEPATMSVREAQQRMVDAGFDPGPVDGLYGRRTKAGLEAFQRAAGIPVTGRIDAATIEALRGGTVTTPSDPAEPNEPAPEDPAATTMAQIQRALKDGPFDPGPIDGVYGTKTKQAIWALEKLAGLPMNGQWSDADAAALQRVMNGQVGGPTTSHSRRWVEIDLSQQLLKVYDPGRRVPILVSHVSTGNGIPWRQGRYSGRSITPTGNFTIFRRVSGWKVSSLGIGSMYNPLYITSSGIALHGSRSVPSYPASHGCIRVPMHIAEYLPSMLPNGTPVKVMP